MTEQTEYVSTTEAARLLGVSRQWVVILLDRGELQGSKVTNRSWIVSRDSVEQLKARRNANSQNEPRNDSNDH